MKVPEVFRINSLKLHTRTTLAVSVVLIAVFAVVAYISNLAINRLSYQGEQQDAQLIATRIASTIEHHIQRQRRNREKSKTETEERIFPNWAEIEETINETILSTHPELSQVRVLYKESTVGWHEEIRLPQTLDPLSPQDETTLKQ